MSLAGCQINPIDVNFYRQKSLEILDKNSADKIWSEKDKGGKYPPSCQLGLIRRMFVKDMCWQLVDISTLDKIMRALKEQ